MLNNVAIIPARGGSKRIPKKNIKKFLGKPIIGITIEKAIQSKLFSRIVVTTDDDEIANIAKLYGAEIPFLRPKKLSDDFTGTIEVVSHAIDALSSLGRNFEYACCLYPCAPFIRVEDLLATYNLLRDSGGEFSFPATEYATSIFRSFEKKENGVLQMIYPEHYSSRSQDLKSIFHDAGQFYWGTTKAWTTSSRIFSDKAYPYIVPRWRVQDIDNEDDWMRAELIAQSLSNLKIL